VMNLVDGRCDVLRPNPKRAKRGAHASGRYPRSGWRDVLSPAHAELSRAN